MKIEKISHHEKEKHYQNYLNTRSAPSSNPIGKSDMSEREMAYKLIDLTHAVVNGAAYYKEFACVGKKLKFGFEEIVSRVLYYTLDLNKLSNNDYFDDYVMRACMRMHIVAPGSYHREKYQLITEMLQNSQIKKVIEFGFGVPGDHVFTALQTDQKITLTDYDRGAITYADATLSCYKKAYHKNIDFRVVDLNTNQYPGDYDAYVFLAALEHTQNPTKHLQMLAKKMPHGSHLITALPIGKIDTMQDAHFIEFLQKENVHQWIEFAGLTIVRSVEVVPNPEVDFFASLMFGGYADLVTDAVKM